MRCLELAFPPLPQLLTVGQSELRPGWRHQRRNFGVYDLIVVSRGTFYMREDNIEYELGAGGLLILEPGKTHEGHRPVPPEGAYVYWLHFLHRQPVRSLEHDQIDWSHTLVGGTDEDTTAPVRSMFLPKTATLDLDAVVPLLEEMNRYHRGLHVGNALALQALLGQLLVKLQNVSRGNIDRRTSRIGDMAASYLKATLQEPFSARRMESELHFRFDYIARCLKLHTGMSPLQYRHHLQIELAKRLLLHSDLSVREIGEQAGFAQSNYFIRLFRTRTGLTPGAYRTAYAGLT